MYDQGTSLCPYLRLWAVTLIYTCMHVSRSRRGQPVGRSVRERAPPTGCGTAAHRGAGAPRRAAVRHLAATARLSRLCQQNTGQVSGARGQQDTAG